MINLLALLTLAVATLPAINAESFYIRGRQMCGPDTNMQFLSFGTINNGTEFAIDREVYDAWPGHPLIVHNEDLSVGVKFTYGSCNFGNKIPHDDCGYCNVTETWVPKDWYCPAAGHNWTLENRFITYYCEFDCEA